MGNRIGSGRRKAKVMKIDGETMKLKTPIQACEVVKGYPGYVLLDSEAVKNFGIRAAKPLEPNQLLKPNKIYFLVELPNFPEEQIARKVSSGIHMSAKDRLECLMLSRRAVSDLTGTASTNTDTDMGEMRVKMRVPRAQLDKLMEDSANDGEVIAEKIVDLYMETSCGGRGGRYSGDLRPEEGMRGNFKGRKKRVSFVPKEGEIHVNEESQKQP